MAAISLTITINTASCIPNLQKMTQSREICTKLDKNTNAKMRILISSGNVLLTIYHWDN